MSWATRFQPLFLSGLLATTSSCPPERFFSGEGDEAAGPDPCPVRGLPPPTEGPDGVQRFLTDLAEREVSSDVFHLEDSNRYRPLEPLCSSAQINRFDGLQEILGDRLAAMAPAQIAGILEGLYGQAYVYNESDKTMAAGASPSQREAKRRLDLWIAAVDQRAFADEGFLERIRSEPRIRAVMALNSPHLDPWDRGDHELTSRALAEGDDRLRRLYRENPMEGYTRLFDWLRTYDGRNEKFFEEPFLRSQTEIYVVFQSRGWNERVLRIGQETFPREAFERLMEERGYGPSYRRFLGLDTEALIRNFHETSMALTPQARPASRRRLVEDLMIMGIVFGQRGIDPQRELERRGIDSMVRSGFSREDAELMYRLQTGAVPYTHDRLDDYQARHGLLREYRTLYRDMLTLPLEDVFSPENRSRYATWGALFLNRSMMKVPIFLEDLDGIRREIQNEVVPTMSFGRGGLDFGFRDPETSQWLTPYDLGLCNSLTGGPMSIAGLATFNGRTADELICSNVELMAFLPASLHHDHALATAIGVFGVITVRGSDSIGDGERLHDAAWTPGSLLEVLTHEAAHIDWFRTNFDSDSQRLPMSALNERRAYITGTGYLGNYFLNGMSQTGEGEALNGRFQFMEELTAATNEALGSPAAGMDVDYWEPNWDAEPPGRFAFQPPDLLQNRRSRELLDARFGHATDEHLDHIWRRVFNDALERLSPEDRRAAIEGQVRISSSSNTAETPVYFLMSDPFMRAVNDARVSFGLMPLTSIDVSADDWTTSRRGMASYMLDRARMDSLRH